MASALKGALGYKKEYSLKNESIKINIIFKK